MTMRTKAARIAAATALLAGTGVAGLAAAPSASADDYGITPGSYTYYAFPSTVTGLSSVTWTTHVSADPGKASNSFWSHQFAFDNGGVAYIGQQRNGGDPSTFLFSVWDATESKPGSDGSYCLTFGGEGVGQSCRIHIDWTAGHTYAYTVAYEGDGWFGATITDQNTKQSFKLGSVKTPDTALLPTKLIDWVEYFEWNDPRATCYDQPYSAAEFGLPKGVATDGAPVTAGVTKTRTSVNACTANTSVDPSEAGTIQRLAIGNSVRGPITSADDKCLAPKRTTSGGTAVDGSPVAFTNCADGTGAFAQGWVLAKDGTVRLPSDYCLKADVDGSLSAVDCKPDEAADLTVSNPAELWSYSKATGTLVNAASGRSLTVSVPRSY